MELVAVTMARVVAVLRRDRGGEVRPGLGTATRSDSLSPPLKFQAFHKPQPFHLDFPVKAAKDGYFPSVSARVSAMSGIPGRMVFAFASASFAFLRVSLIASLRLASASSARVTVRLSASMW